MDYHFWLGLLLACGGGLGLGWGLWHSAQARALALAWAQRELHAVAAELRADPTYAALLVQGVWRTLPPAVRRYVPLAQMQRWAQHLLDTGPVP